MPAAATPGVLGITTPHLGCVNAHCTLSARKLAMRTDFCWHMLQNCYLAIVMSAVPPSPHLRVDAWTDFWRDARVDGCTAAFPPRVAEAISAGWRRLFTAARTGDSLIDIACGRGAVLHIAREARLAAITGVDLAAISDCDPAIRTGVDAGSLPYPDRAFTIAASQFGIEYAGLEAAGIEAARVARRHLWLLVHAADGPVVEQALEQVAQATWLMSAGGVLDLLAGQACGSAAARAATIEQLQAELVHCAGSMVNTGLLEAVWQAAGAQIGSPDVSAVAALRIDIATYAERLRLMAEAAPDATEVARLGQRLEQRGFAVAITAEGAPPVARWIIATRR